MSSQRVDLQALAVRRAATTDTAIHRPRRWFSRVLVPLILLGGFGGLLLWSSWDVVVPATPVTVTPVVSQAGIVQATGVELFTATGWLEPGPTPIDVPALAEGVVEKLLVLPGQRIAAGEPIAQLVDADARLAVRVAEDELAERRLKVKTAEADVAEANAQLRGAEATVKADEELFLKKVIGQVRYEQTVAQRAVATAKVEQAKARQSEAQARVRQGETQLAIAQLRLERMTVRAPCAGIVMSLNALPGSMVGTRRATEATPDSVVRLYDPERLQVRIEVPIDKFQLVQPRQPVVLEVDVLPGQRVHGTLLYDTHETGLNGNTVRVKASIDRLPVCGFAWPWALPSASELAGEGVLNAVCLASHRLDDPLSRLRPGMVGRVRVQSLPTASAPATGGEVLRLFVPQRLVVTEGGQAVVWIVDQAAGRALLRPVTVGRVRDGDRQEIAQGLQPSDKLITSARETLKPGQRVRIAAEEP